MQKIQYDKKVLTTIKCKDCHHKMDSKNSFVWVKNDIYKCFDCYGI